MEGLSQVNTVLHLIPQPAFRVENGVITHVNQAASAYYLQPGQAFAPMILSGSQEYEELTAGELYMTLSLEGICVGARVCRVDNSNIVILEQSADSPHLQAMVLAAKTLKKPLGEIMTITNQILPAVAAQDSKLERQAAQLNQELYKMLRILLNMSDAADYLQAQPNRMETLEICSFLEEILEKVAFLTQGGNISIAFDLPNEQVFTLADREKLKRSVFNLLSNAIKTASPETTVRVKLAHKNKRLYFSVSNTHPGAGPQGGIFNRYLRNPAQMDDPKDGVGLGMAIVYSTAMLHGGAVLFDKTEDGSRVTMTLQVKTGSPNQVRSPISYWDYAGEHDHCLLELSDILPAEVYKPENLK